MDNLKYGSLAENYLDRVFFETPACKIFTVLPMWISQGFDTPHKHRVNSVLGQANLYLTLYLHLQDDIIDEPERTDRYLLLVGTSFFLQLTKLYHSLFPHDSMIWAAFEDVFTSYACATLKEREYTFRNLHEIPDHVEIDISLASQKFSPLKLCCYAHALLSRSEEKRFALSEMIDRYGAAIQLHNDLMDWKEDLERGQLSYPTLLLLQEYRRLFEMPPSLEGMQVLMANSCVAERVLHTEIAFLEEAHAAIENLGLPSLKHYLKTLVATLLGALPETGSTLCDLLEPRNEPSCYPGE